jgi:hypothetical protein
MEENIEIVYADYVDDQLWTTPVVDEGEENESDRVQVPVFIGVPSANSITEDLLTDDLLADTAASTAIADEPDVMLSDGEGGESLQ